MDLNELKDYYNRVFNKNPIGMDKPLSSTSYRLAALLIKELDFFSFKKLPQRKKIAETLNVSYQAVLDSLVQLEKIGFILRSIPEPMCPTSDKNEQVIKEQYVKEYFVNELKSKRFNDTFVLNPYYNTTEEDYIYLIYKDIIKQYPNIVTTYNYISTWSKNDLKPTILNAVVEDLIEHTYHIFNNISKSSLIPIVKDLLDNSKCIPIASIGKSSTPLTIVHIDEEHLKKEKL